VGRRGIGSAAADPARRVCDPEWAPPGTETAFSDRQPYLLASEVKPFNEALNEALHLQQDHLRAGQVTGNGANAALQVPCCCRRQCMLADPLPT